MASDTELKVVITSEIAGLKTGMAQAQDSVKSAMSEMKNTFKSGESAASGGIGNIVSALGTLGPAVAGAAAAFAGFEIVKSSIGAFKDFAHEVGNLSKIMGISTEAASQLTGTLKVLGLGSDEYISIMMKMARQLKRAPEDFERLGISVRNADGTFREQPAILESVIDKMKEYKPGMDQVMFAMDALGPRGASAAFSLTRMKEASEIATPVMQRLGLEMGENAVDAARRLEMRSNALSLVMTGLKVKIGEELIGAIKPTMGILDGLITVVNILIQAFKGLLAVLDVVGAAFLILLDTVIGVVAAIASAMNGLGNAMIKIAQGDFSGAWKAIKDGGINAYKNLEMAGNSMLATARNTAKEIMGLWEKEAPGPGKAKGTATYTPKPEDSKAKSRMGEWELELSELRKKEEEKGAIEGTYRQFSKAEELKFWQDKLSRLKMSAEEEQAVKKKIYSDEDVIRKSAFQAYMDGLKNQVAEARKGSAERVDLAKKEWDAVISAHGAGSKEAVMAERAYTQEVKAQNLEILKLKEQMSEAKKEWDLQDLKTAEERLNTELEINKAALEKEFDLFGTVQRKKDDLERKHLESLKALKAQEYEIEKTAIVEKMNLMKLDPSMDPVAYAKIEDSIITLTKKKNTEIQKLDTALVKSEIKGWDDMKKVFGKLFDPLTDGFSAAIRGVITGTQTLQQAIANMAQNIVLSFIDMGIKIAMNWLANQIAMMVGTKAIKTEEATGVVTANAAEAASGGAAAMASIPYIGPVLAVAAAAAMMALVMGFMSMTKASGGYDIPYGINPVVQTHGGEMILPANLAQGIRNMTDQGGGSKGNFIFAPKINAIDSKSFVSTLKNSRSDLTRYFKQALRDYRMG
jgi:hypothetical protein